MTANTLHKQSNNCGKRLKKRTTTKRKQRKKKTQNLNPIRPTSVARTRKYTIEKYEIEAIVARRKKGDVDEVLVKWRKYF